MQRKSREAIKRLAGDHRWRMEWEVGSLEKKTFPGRQTRGTAINSQIFVEFLSNDLREPIVSEEDN